MYTLAVVARQDRARRERCETKYLRMGTGIGDLHVLYNSTARAGGILTTSARHGMNLLDRERIDVSCACQISDLSEFSSRTVHVRIILGQDQIICGNLISNAYLIITSCA